MCNKLMVTVIWDDSITMISTDINYLRIISIMLSVSQVSTQLHLYAGVHNTVYYILFTHICASVLICLSILITV